MNRQAGDMTLYSIAENLSALISTSDELHLWQKVVLVSDLTHVERR